MEAQIRNNRRKRTKLEKQVLGLQRKVVAVAAMNAAVTEGGVPVGIIAYTLRQERGSQKTIRVYVRTLKEFEDEEWARTYLGKLVAAFKAELESRYGPARFDKNTGWVN